MKTGFNDKNKIDDVSARSNVNKDIENNSNYEINKEDKTIDEKDIIVPIPKKEIVNYLYSKDFSYETQLKMIKGKIVRTIREKYFNPDKKTYTNVDMDSFSLSEKIKKDKRTFFEYYWEIVNDYNAISFAFIKKTILIPKIYRVFCLFQYANLYLLLNAMFFYDESIELRNNPQLTVVLHNIRQTSYLQ